MTAGWRSCAVLSNIDSIASCPFLSFRSSYCKIPSKSDFVFFSNGYIHTYITMNSLRVGKALV